MKHIVKRDDGDEPRELTDLVAKASDAYKPTYDALGSERKQIVHQALIDDQGWICCYCEIRIGKEDSHIEHWRPQSKCEYLEDLAYDNMLASCQRDRRPKREAQQCCGVRKDNWYDESLMVSPLSADCEKRFRFTAGGDILPAREDDRAAKTTIKRLGLDISKLRKMRRDAIDGALGDDLGELPDQDLQKLILGYCERDGRGKFQPACTAVVCVLIGQLTDPLVADRMRSKCTG